MTKRPIGPVDNLWLGMDTPENLMVIDGVLWFPEPLDTEAAIAVLDERLPTRYPVFRQHPVPTRDPRYHAMWEDDEDFDIREHIFHIELESPGSQAQLQEYVDRVISLPLRTDRSPWEAHLISGYGEGSALYIRLHHAMADGTALARVILELTEEDPNYSDDTGEELIVAEIEPESDDEHKSKSLTDRIVSSMTSLVSDVGHASLSMFHQISTLADPRNYPDVTHLLSESGHLVSDSGHSAAKLFGTQLPNTVLSGEVGVAKNARWSDPIPLDKIKQIAHSNDATVNDVLVSILAGAMARYIEAHDEVPQDVCTMVPVNLRALDRPLPRELGNKFALVMMILPLSAKDPISRLRETKARMDVIKESPEAILTFGLISTFGSFNPAAAKFMIDFFSNKAVGITTNVPGPQTHRVFAGVPVGGVVGWAPGAGKQSLNACIFSLNGQITVGFKTDVNVFPNSTLLLEAFMAEYEALFTA